MYPVDVKDSRARLGDREYTFTKRVWYTRRQSINKQTNPIWGRQRQGPVWVRSRFGTRVGVRRSGRKSRKGEPKAESIRQAGVGNNGRSINMKNAGTLETRRNLDKLATRKQEHTDNMHKMMRDR